MRTLIFVFLLLIGLLPVAQAQVNVRVDALGPLIGSYGVEVDIPISSAWTIGPSVRILSRSDGNFDVSGYGAGVRANYWLKGAVFTEGWYVGPLVQFIKVEVEDTSSGSSLEGDATGANITGFFGYQWMWEQFNLNFGAGPSYYTVNDITVKDGDGNRRNYGSFTGIGIGLEFNLGWKF